MNEIKCPHCGEYFKVDESGYADIVRQVRDAEFEKSVDDAVSVREEVMRAKATAELAKKDQEMASLKAELGAIEDKHALELDHLKLAQASELEQMRLAKESETSSLKAELGAIADKHDLEMQQLKLAQEAKDAQSAADVERERLRARDERDKALRAKDELIAERDSQLRAKDDMIALREREIQDLHEMRSKLSVKLLGESLEQHCEVAFNQMRATAFRNSEFGKDNEAVEGTKGDYIFRERTDTGAELISIMFEMKTESEVSQSTSKKTNESHLKKLDEDRRKKGCEYAVLVSTLEADSELYNQGIVDVSHLYPKMFVIRPQFFIPLISLLRNAALDSAKYKDELELQRRQEIDVAHFEEALLDFKDKFGRNYQLASKRFEAAIEEIDKAIARLTKVKENLIGSERQLELANKKADGLTVKKLVRGNPTMKEKFKALEAAKEEEE
ncbi:MAG: DUF2130 domain-containing protein [Eggerthellaceae bacterium]|nr:DUF2130 domain-containing protein [Eggerthellaceae bacterium]